MVSVQFKAVAPGTCRSWCRKEKSEVFLAVVDGRGPKWWCWNCLRHKVESELDDENELPGETSASPSGSKEAG